MANVPLQGTRILDLSHYLAGPFATQLLTDLGAQVIKIEPVYGDLLRGLAGLVGSGSAPPPATGAHNQPYNRRLGFNDVHRGKLGAVVDLSKPGGVELVRGLVRITDVLVENYSPRVMGKFGLDYETLRLERPDIIMVSMPAFGSTGPYQNYTAVGPGINAMSGVAYLTGYIGGPPLRPGGVYSDYFSGLNAAFAILVALSCRRRTGRGQHVEVAMREAETMVIGEALIDYAMNHRVQTRVGNSHPWMAPHGCYKCKGKDKYVAIAVGSDEEWQQFLGVLGNPAWAKEERFSDAFQRWRNQEDLDRLIEQWTAERDHYQVMEALQNAGVSAGAVLDTQEVWKDPHIKQRGFYAEITHPEMGKHPVRGLPWRLSQTPIQIDTPAPCFAQHNDYVFRELLGVSQQQMLEFHENKVTSDVPITPRN